MGLDAVALEETRDRVLFLASEAKRQHDRLHMEKIEWRNRATRYLRALDRLEKVVA